MANASPLSRRHHFLPQFYLRQWLDNLSQQPGQAPGVWKISRDGLSARRYNPQNRVFWIEHANTLTSTTGTQTDLPERLLGRVETVVAETLHGPIAAHEPVGRDQFDAINMFFSSLLVRVPSARAAMQAGIDAQARIERETAEFRGLPIPDTTLFQQNAMAHAVSNALTAILPELDRMCHRILMAPPGEFFVTGDRPAQIWAPVGFQGIANRFCEATLPLSGSRLLLLTWSPLEQSGYCPISTERLLEFNRRTIEGCHEWFVSRTEQTDPRWFAR